MYTLSELWTEVRDNVRRPANDPKLTDAVLTRAINRKRRDIWAAIGVDDGSSVRLSVVAGQASYDLAGHAAARVLAVSVQDAPYGAFRQLKLASRRAMIDAGFLPGAGAGQPPLYYRVQPWACAQSPAMLFGSPELVSQAALLHGPVVTLTPAPSIGVSGGLEITIAGAAAPLQFAGDISPLPECVDDAAVLAAAVDLAPRLGRDPSQMVWLPVLRGLADDAFEAAREYVMDLDGPLGPIYPFDNFGEGGGFFALGSSPTQAPPAAAVAAAAASPVAAAANEVWVYADAVPVMGEASVSYDAVSEPLCYWQTVEAVRAVSQDMGEIFNVTLDGTTFTATLRAGITFGADDVVRFFWPTEGA